MEGGCGGEKGGRLSIRRSAPIWRLLLTYESLMLKPARRPLSRLNNSFGSRSALASSRPISLCITKRPGVKNGLLGFPCFSTPSDPSR